MFTFIFVGKNLFTLENVGYQLADNFLYLLKIFIMRLFYFLSMILFIGLMNAQNLTHESGDAVISRSFSYFYEGEEIKKDEYKEIIKDDALAFERFNKHLRNKNWANMFEYANGLILTINFVSWVTGNGFSWEIIGVSAGLAVPIYFLNEKAENLLNDIEQSFNDKVSVKFVGDQYGVGVGFRF